MCMGEEVVDGCAVGSKYLTTTLIEYPNYRGYHNLVYIDEGR